jgi:16S rRNA (cytidine1402-2'-O)-methyltransferase
MSVLYIVATPIGNLEDISQRALRVLREADLVLCEDTRRTKKLLSFYKIRNRVLSYHQRSRLRKLDYIVRLLREGKNLALVSDAGTPGISDPGNRLVAKVLEETDARIIPVPGPSAVAAIASVAGFPMDKFLFLGFSPKRKKKRFFERMKNSEYPVVFFESPQRIIKTLGKMREAGVSGEIVVGRELTKRFEVVYRGRIGEVVRELEKEKMRGEFVILVNINEARPR